MKQEIAEAPLGTMLTLRQVAHFLHVSMSTVRQWSDGGMLKSYRVGPRGDRRYLRDDVLRFLEESALNLREDKGMEEDRAGLPGGEPAASRKGGING